MRLLILLACLWATPLYAAKEQAQEPDPLDVAATLLRDGYDERAKEVLAKVDVQSKRFDFVRYYTLMGILNHNRGYADVSNIFIKEAITQGQENKSIYLYMAKNHWELKEYPEVIRILNEAGDAALENEQMFMMKAEAYKQMNDYPSAWAALDEGIARFPEYSKFYMQKFYYLIELGYYEHALDYAGDYLKRQEYTQKDYLAVAYALRSNGQYEKAAMLLEEAVLRHPGDEKLLELLGQVYIDQEKYLTASTVFDRASIQYPRFAHKAAALYLKANHPVRSLQLNRRINKQAEKFRQRLSIDIHLEDYEALVTKTAYLKRYGLLKDDDILYAVGYAHYRNGDYDEAVRYLKKIKNSELFARASSIFKIIEKCENEPAQCL